MVIQFPRKPSLLRWHCFSFGQIDISDCKLLSWLSAQMLTANVYLRNPQFCAISSDACDLHCITNWWAWPDRTMCAVRCHMMHWLHIMHHVFILSKKLSSVDATVGLKLGFGKLC